jgi:hypothetical protein
MVAIIEPCNYDLIEWFGTGKYSKLGWNYDQGRLIKADQSSEREAMRVLFFRRI